MKIKANIHILFLKGDKMSLYGQMVLAVPKLTGAILQSVIYLGYATLPLFIIEYYQLLTTFMGDDSSTIKWANYALIYVMLLGL